VLATEGKAHVYGVSMKDRAAILTSGHTTNGAFWIDHDTGQLVTSTYWMNQLPKWATEFNASGRAEEARKESGAPNGSFGPDDPSQKALIVQSNALLDAFFTSLDKTIGLKNVMVAMTGDHGVATTQKSGDAIEMPVLDFPAAQFTKPVEAMLEAKYPPKGKGAYVVQMDNAYLLLNQQAFEAAGVGEEEAETTTKVMVEQVFANFVHAGDGSAIGRQKDPRH
jgi:hypothetical protein